MADRLVDLQRHLLAAEDQRRLAARAQWRRQQRPRLLGDAGRVGLDVDLVDELPAPRAVLAARRRVRPALRLAVADGRRHDAGPALAHPLVDAWPLARHEPLGRVPDLVHRPRPGRRRGRPSSPWPASNMSPFVASETPSGSMTHSLAHDPVCASPAISARRRPGTPWRSRSAIAVARDPADAGGGVVQVGHGVEPPSRTDQGAHPDAGVLALADVLDLTVAGRHRLVATVHHPGVGVAGAGVEGRLDGRLGGLELAHPPS